jgi:hypothetical protein
MIVPTCRQCPTPLKQSQAKFCSNRCRRAGQYRLAARGCAQCGRELTRKQLRHRVACCSNACARAWFPSKTPVLDVLLGILRGNTHTWMTVSDLAIWVHGFDDTAEYEAIRAMVYRLRGLGYVIADRRVTWVPVRGCAHAYRLVSEPSAHAREAA